jgi:hypothetical protein
VGFFVGLLVGDFVGATEGAYVGCFVGERVGCVVGLAVGTFVGVVVGGGGAGQTGLGVGRFVGTGQGLLCRLRFKVCEIPVRFVEGSSSMKRWPKLSFDVTSILSIMLGFPPSLSRTSTKPAGVVSRKE